MSYTTQELNTAVEKIVRTSIRREYGALGNRRVDRTFSDLQDAAAGVFILFANAPFYIVLLAARRLQKAIETEQALIESFIESVEATDRRVLPITGLSPLANARTALTNLSGATTQRTTDFVDITGISAFQRFESNTQRFLDESSKNVVAGGEIVQTPGEARSNLAGLFRELRSQHADIVRRAALVGGAIDDFNQLSLAKTLSENIITNSRTVIDDVLNELEGLTEKERLAIIRRVTLDILATRAAVRGFGSISGPPTFLTLEGIGQVFADADHLATPAFVQSDILGPYPILTDGRDLDITLDGGTSPTTTIQVVGSFVALIESTLTDESPFNIGTPNGVGTQNGELRIVLKNYPAVGTDSIIDVTFPTDATTTIDEVVAAITAAVTTATPPGDPRIPLTAEPYPNPQKFSGLVDLDATGSISDMDFITVNPSVDFTTLGIKEGDHIYINKPTSANFGAIYDIDVGGLTASTLTCTQLSGPAPANELLQTIEVGDKGLALRLRVSDNTDIIRVVQPTPAYQDYRLQALIDRVSINLPVVGFTASTEDPEDVQFNSATTIGLFPGMDAISRRTPAQALVNAYNLSAQTSVVGIVRTSAKAVFVAQYYSGRGRTEPSDFLKLIASKFQGVGDVTGGTAVVFTVPGALTAGALVGDIVVLRSAVLAAEINTKGTITSVDDTAITATMDTAITAAAGIDIEVGPDLSAIGFDPTAMVSGGSFNDGQYDVTAIGTIPFELDIAVQLPVPAGAGYQPIILSLEVGRFAVKFSSLDTTLSTAIEIDAISVASAAPKFFNPLPVSDVGETKYFQLPEWSKTLEQDDILERNISAVGTPDTTHTITGLEQSALLIELDPELPTDTAAITMSKDQPIPFARIRKKRLNTFLLLQSELEGWLELSDNQTQFFTNFSRRLNPLAIDSNPTIVEVNDARLELQGLNTTLTQLDGFLGAYTADEVVQVDSLLQGFQQKGADRAVDIILEARFTTFFGLSQDDLSYAGNVQRRIREINREDLPLRKNRQAQGDRSADILAEYDDVDFEYNQDDIDTSPEPDIPIGADIDWPERAY